jgi:glycosyltransferase involved in cell wall biosynthesis
VSGGRRTRGRLLFVVVPQVYFLSHRLPLALAAARDGWEVHLATAPGEGGDEITRRGIVLHRVPLHRAIASPVQELRSLGALVRLCRALRPALVHAVSVKGVVLGGVAARMLGIPAVLMKGGMGTAVTEPGAANRLARVAIRAGVRVGLGGRAALVVYNPDEADEVASTGWMRSRTLVVAGSGVDCQAFHPTPEPPPPVTVTLPARMLRSKGVEDFVAAARLLAARGVRARFVLAGGADPGNATAIAPGELEGGRGRGWWNGWATAPTCPPCWRAATWCAFPAAARRACPRRSPRPRPRAAPS